MKKLAILLAALGLAASAHAASLTKTPTTMISGLGAAAVDGTTLQQQGNTLSILAVPAGTITAPSVNDFTGDGSTTAFTLSSTPSSVSRVKAWVGGVYQVQASYTVSGTTLTFGSAPPSGTAIEVLVGTN